VSQLTKGSVIGHGILGLVVCLFKTTVLCEPLLTRLDSSHAWLPHPGGSKCFPRQLFSSSLSVCVCVCVCVCVYIGTYTYLVVCG
jgi:hypothetical protein